jgi:hypothetical protein
MIISNKHKFVFIHNPKVAGTSIRSALSHLHDDERTFWHQSWLQSESRVIDSAHMTADLWEPRVNPEYTVFGFVRHPMNRLISGLHEFRRRHGAEFDLTTTEKVKSFVMNVMTPANLRWDWRFIHLCPQHYFFYLGNKSLADKIGKYEDLTNSWASVCSLIGLPITLPHDRQANPSTVHEFDEALSAPEVYERINSLYLRDFLLFDYPVLGNIDVATHSQRIAAIHDPSRYSHLAFDQMNAIQFPEGELKALYRKRGH